MGDSSWQGEYSIRSQLVDHNQTDGCCDVVHDLYEQWGDDKDTVWVLAKHATPRIEWRSNVIGAYGKHERKCTQQTQSSKGKPRDTYVTLEHESAGE